jgi:pyocin large subunit-like protein
MAKRGNGTKRTSAGRTTTNAPGETTADAMEQRVVAFAEQLGRIAGTFQAKAEGWMDRETLNKQIASVRDGAAHLLEQLAGGATKALKKKPAGAAQGIINLSIVVDTPTSARLLEGCSHL